MPSRHLRSVESVQAMDELLEAYSALLVTRREIVNLLASIEGRPAAPTAT